MNSELFPFMKTEIKDISPTLKQIDIEIEAEAVRAVYDRISDRYAKQATVPGFRPGHAPRAVVRNRFKNEIRGQVLQELVPEAVDAAIHKHELHALGEPDVQLENAESLEKLGETPVSVKVNVEVLPKVDLHDYKNIEVVRQTRPITDERVTEMLDALRETSAAMQPVEDRGAALGDTVTINVEGKFVDLPEEENIQQDDVEVTLGG